MTFRFFRRPAMAAVALATATLLSGAPAQAVNLFSVSQDVQVGQQAARDAERRMRLVHDRAVNAYVNAVGQRLAAHAPGPRFRYQFKVVDASDINAFALPGGYIYVNRGLLRAVRSEAELAGVMAHEIAHVAERHGTEQATKAYGAQAGLGLLGRLIAGRDRRVGLPERIAGAVGLQAAFMKFSRDNEHEADRVGVQIMSRAGYDPRAMADFFDLLQAQRRRNPGAVARFFSSHPAPVNRSANIRAQAQGMRRGNGRTVGNLRAVQARLA